MSAHSNQHRSPKTIHPFPARMAPEIAFEVINNLERGSTVADPMCGSGLVLRTAVQQGHKAIGFDVDPLAVLMSRVWTQSLDTSKFIESSKHIVEQAKSIRQSEVSLPWIDEDEETSKYIDYWFAKDQKEKLRILAYLITGKQGAVYRALQLAISRLIVTKKVGASLAWDVSHSRPHRVKLNNDYDVLAGFETAVARITDGLVMPPSPDALVSIGDARRLSSVPDGYVDVVVTSPPYFSAIDYIRGHRLALVWLGYRVSRLRRIRAMSLGGQRALEGGKAQQDWCRRRKPAERTRHRNTITLQKIRLRHS